MNLDDTQKQQIAAWVAEGLRLSEVQKRMETELGIRMTYMELRLLIDDLQVMPKDPEPSVPPSPSLAKDQGPLPEQAVEPSPSSDSELGDAGVSVSIDSVTRPGAVVSGGVRFSDGQPAAWYLDQTGRLGLVPQQQGYRPSPSDLQAFQMELQSELQRMGF